MKVTLITLSACYIPVTCLSALHEISPLMYASSAAICHLFIAPNASTTFWRSCAVRNSTWPS
ncbi:hypothetical protein EVA_04950 [gut metagenome]|uniref:Uncharacterized protein n=1 Tax=gut metagenome TaxID=749906 RepID=J9GVK4_9ZZZZ